MISYDGDYAPEFRSTARYWWFASSALLAELFHAELRVITRFLEENPDLDLPTMFDSPDATLPQRSTCFSLLAHGKLISIIDEQYVSRSEQPPALDDVESSSLRRIPTLVPADAPLWVLEMNNVIELLPERMLQAMPEPLQTPGWYTNDPQKADAQRSAGAALSTVAQIQAFTKQVIDQQWRRLLGRWSSVAATSMGQGQTREEKKPKHWLKGTKGLTRKADLSRYKQGLTDKQELAFSLKYEYQIGPTEIAARMGIDRKTLAGHLDAANRNIKQIHSREKRGVNRAKSNADS